MSCNSALNESTVTEFTTLHDFFVHEPVQPTLVSSPSIRYPHLGARVDCANKCVAGAHYSQRPPWLLVWRSRGSLIMPSEPVGWQLGMSGVSHCVQGGRPSSRKKASIRVRAMALIQSTCLRDPPCIA
jgi:hypothetical protein